MGAYTVALLVGAAGGFQASTADWPGPARRAAVTAFASLRAYGLFCRCSWLLPSALQPAQPSQTQLPVAAGSPALHTRPYASMCWLSSTRTSLQASQQLQCSPTARREVKGMPELVICNSRTDRSLGTTTPTAAGTQTPTHSNSSPTQAVRRLWKHCLGMRGTPSLTSESPPWTP